MRHSYYLFFMLFVVSCNQNHVFDEFQHVGSEWKKNDIKEFSFVSPDTTDNYNLFINIRNTNEYKYNNLFLIAAIECPNGKVVSDTLQYRMAGPDGKLLGSGMTAIKENKLWYKGHASNFKFEELGDYKLKLSHAVRAYGEVDADDKLIGITDVGFRIEKTTE